MSVHYYVYAVVAKGGKEVEDRSEDTLGELWNVEYATHEDAEAAIKKLGTTVKPGVICRVGKSSPA